MKTEFSADDYRFMSHAIRLAYNGWYSAHPNPRVGCVLVKNNRIIGEGWHRQTGGAHAEKNALNSATTTLENTTAFVTLEPCSHHGRTPPCADALIDAGINRVIAAMSDPNPQVSGRGIDRLRAAGVEVKTGLCEQQARALNLGFIKRMTSGLPLIRIKLAASMDGRTASANGESMWITGEHARLDVQRLRAQSAAIVTGVSTVLADNPRLTVRGQQYERQPLRVVLDSQLRTPPGAKIFEGEGNVLIITTSSNTEKKQALEQSGARVVVQSHKGQVDLLDAMQTLASLQINDVLVESGPTLAGAFVQAGLADELVIYLAPILLGCHGPVELSEHESGIGNGLFNMPVVQSLSDKIRLKITDTRVVGNDLRMTARITPRENI